MHHRDLDRISLSAKARRLARMLTYTRAAWKELRQIQKCQPLTTSLSGPVAKRWAANLLDQFHVDVVLTGAEPLAQPCLRVSNHVSYLDILVWLISAPCCFLSKSGVKGVPLIGSGATMLGTVYLERNRQDSRQAARDSIARAVHEGERQLVVFPGGTTSRSGLPWRHGAFEVAARHGLWVQATTLRYCDPALIGWEQEPFPSHLWEILGSRRRLSVEVHFFEPEQIEHPQQAAARLQALVRDHALATRGASHPDCARVSV
ncbi:MAG: 1-acyl-sn-glycerol-3-phosphate acyltransferase [Planctomycetes bacterium]|nr:1-acyl-sn-glycerol-3-phosphate acyltransferase [Planctomycetota bacterium]